MTDFEKCERVLNNLSADNCLLLVPTGAYSLSSCMLMGGATVKSFSSVNQMKLTTDARYLFSSCLARTRRVILFASVSSCDYFFLKYCRRRSLWMMRWTDDLWMFLSHAIYLTVLWVHGASSWLSTSSSTSAMFVLLCPVRPLPPPCLFSADPLSSICAICRSRARRLQFLCGNSDSNLCTLYPLSFLKIVIKTRSSWENTIFRWPK